MPTDHGLQSRPFLLLSDSWPYSPRGRDGSVGESNTVGDAPATTTSSRLACRAIGVVIAVLTASQVGHVPVAEADDNAWLRHIASPVAVTETPVRADQLIRELAVPELDADDYTPAEQIAGYALHELRRGNDADAALLLSIASYRYFQQAVLAVAIGARQSWRVNPLHEQKYKDYLRDEFLFFSRQDFDDELDLLRDRLFGAPMAAERRERYVARLAAGGEEDRDFAQRLRDFEETVSNRPERLMHERLAAAYLARLVADDGGPMGKHGFARYYLATTPIDRFRLAALDRAKEPFHAQLLRNLVPRIHTLRREVRARLRASTPDVRSNAALALGLAADRVDRRGLVSRLRREKDPRVIDSLRFALIRHGEVKYIDALVTRARKAKGEDRAHALLLLQWLPEQQKAELDEALFVALATSSGLVTESSRAYAISILRDMAGRKSLGHRSVVALLELTGDESEAIVKVAGAAVRALGQLGAAECKAFYGQYPGARPALIARLGDVASMADLEFLRQAHDASRDDAKLGSAVVSAVARIPGAASRQLLQRWFKEVGKDDPGRMSLVIALASRSDADRDALDDDSLSRVKRLMIDVASGGDELVRISPRLTLLAIDDLVQLAALAYIFERHDLAPALWRLASYRAHRFYPFDAVVRRVALTAVLRNAMKAQGSSPSQASGVQ